MRAACAVSLRGGLPHYSKRAKENYKPNRKDPVNVRLGKKNS